MRTCNFASGAKSALLKSIAPRGQSRDDGLSLLAKIVVGGVLFAATLGGIAALARSKAGRRAIRAAKQTATHAAEQVGDVAADVAGSVRNLRQRGKRSNRRAGRAGGGAAKPVRAAKPRDPVPVGAGGLRFHDTNAASNLVGHGSLGGDPLSRQAFPSVGQPVPTASPDINQG